jgi:hypothetical protein
MKNTATYHSGMEARTLIEIISTIRHGEILSDVNEVTNKAMYRRHFRLVFGRCDVRLSGGPLVILAEDLLSFLRLSERMPG